MLNYGAFFFPFSFSGGIFFKMYIFRGYISSECPLLAAVRSTDDEGGPSGGGGLGTSGLGGSASSTEARGAVGDRLGEGLGGSSRSLPSTPAHSHLRGFLQRSRANLLG